VQIVDDTVNCTLEAIDAICLDFQQIELFITIKSNIATYTEDSLGEEIPGAEQDWFNCNVSEDQLCSEAIDYIRGKLS
jgi:hypothetical protein